MDAVLFDLDNTIYDHKQYFLSALKEIAGYLAKKYKLPKAEIYEVSVSLWHKKTSAYPFLFNDLLKVLKIKDDKSLRSLVRMFNRHKCVLKAYPGVKTVLKKLKKQGYILGIITDGNVKRQAGKIKKLGIKKFFKIIIYTKMIAEKPSAKPFLAAAAKLKIDPRDAVFVGDNPAIDFKGAKDVGMKTVRVLTGEFSGRKSNKYIDREIRGLSGVFKALK